MAEHAVLGASGAYRWIACPGSVRMQAALRAKGIVPRPSRFALEGTVAHEILAWCLKNSRSADEVLGRPIASFIQDPDMLIDVEDLLPELVEVDEEMAQGMQTHIDEVVTHLTNAALLQVETRIDLSSLEPPAPMFGTADTIIYYTDTQLLRVIDFKYGRGVPVEVKGNHQLRYYALGSWLDATARGRKVTAVEAVIVQPRAPHRDGPVRRETIAPLDLYEWSADLMKFAAATQEPDAPLVAGDHCRFCEALATCPAVADKAMLMAQSDFAALPDVTVPQPNMLTPEQIGRVLDGADLLSQWLDAVKSHGHHLLEIGVPVPGWKLGARRARRKFEPATEDMVKVLTGPEFTLEIDEIWEDPKLKSPAQMEKLLNAAGKRALAEYIIKPETGTTLMRDTDARPAVQGQRALQDFSVVPQRSSAEEDFSIVDLADDTANAARQAKDTDFSIIGGG